MKNRFLVGFASGFIIAYLGEIIIDSSDGGFWSEFILLLIGAAIIAFLWFIRKRPEEE
ncbi:hypothetical protein ACFLS4_04685 [Bacteroidota bacterium]